MVKIHKLQDWKKNLDKLKKKYNNILLIISVSCNERFKVANELKLIFDSAKISIISVKYFKSNFKSSENLSKKYLNETYDLIIGFGGGSTLDFAKFFISLKLLRINSSQVKEQKIKELKINKKIDFIAIPTTAGSGSESTKFAVTYINGKKYSIENDILLPKKYILDPHLSFTCTKTQKISSALDALCQAIESSWSNNASKESIKYSFQSIKFIWENIESAILQNDFISHQKILIGSNLAGKAINISKTTGPHALSYYISKKFKVSHGLSVALTMPAFLDLHAQHIINNNSKSKKLTNSIKFLEKTMRTRKNNIANTFKKKVKSLGISLNLINFNIRKHNLFLISKSIDPVRLQNNPVELNSELIMKILTNSL